MIVIADEILRTECAGNTARWTQISFDCVYIHARACVCVWEFEVYEREVHNLNDNITNRLSQSKSCRENCNVGAGGPTTSLCISKYACFRKDGKLLCHTMQFSNI